MLTARLSAFFRALRAFVNYPRTSETNALCALGSHAAATAGKDFKFLWHPGAHKKEGAQAGMNVIILFVDVDFYVRKEIPVFS